MLVLNNKSENNVLINISNEYNYWCIDLSNEVTNQINFKELESKESMLILPVPNYNFIISSNINFKVNKKNRNSISKSLKTSLLTKYIWNFRKVRYHGKGYKIRKCNKLSKLTCRFGKSHWTKVFFNKKYVVVRRTKKNTYTFFVLKKKNFFFLKGLVLNIKGINRYTKRGVRLSRQGVKKRFGKVSQASSVYK
jgi:hypothetical protein